VLKGVEVQGLGGGKKELGREEQRRGFRRKNGEEERRGEWEWVKTHDKSKINFLERMQMIPKR
jgi:hypothetical protein